MTKKRWDEVLTRFRATTNLVHDKEQLGSRYRQLKSLYGFIKKLKTQLGLGRREGGSVIATEDEVEDFVEYAEICTSCAKPNNSSLHGTV